MDNKAIDAGDVQEWIAVSYNRIYFYYDWGGSGKSYSFDDIEFQDVLLQILSDQVVFIAKFIHSSDPSHILVLRLDTNGDILSN